MKTKEEILQKMATIELRILMENGFDIGNLERAMDEYAKQEAIEFYKFCMQRISEYMNDIKKIKDWYDMTGKEQKMVDEMTEFETSIKKRYELYLQSKEQ